MESREMRHPSTDTVQRQRTESFKRQLPLRIPLHPNRVTVPEFSAGCGRPKGEQHRMTQLPYRWDFGVTDNISVSAWCKPVQPQFQTLYQEFESMKEKGQVMLPRKFDDAPGNAEQSDDSDLAGAMLQFMTSYTPTSNFSRGVPMNDWSKEAENLLKELTEYEAPSCGESSIWSTDYYPSKSDRGWGGRCDAWSGSPTTLNISDEYSFDIHRHITEINPSPYPGCSPTSSFHIGSNHSSDNDADDEVQSSAESTVETIGMRSLKPPPSFASTTFDSGYISSSTECEGKREGDMAQRQRLSSESDERSSISAAPSSPIPSYAWDSSRLKNPVRYAFPPPLPPFVASVSAFPMPPPAQLFQPHIQQAAAMPPVHPPAFLPGIPPPHRNVAFVTPVPQSYSQPHYVRQRFDAASQSVGGTYHKHKPWITDEILEMIAVRDRLYKRMKKHPATDIVEMYKKVRNMVVGMTRNAKRSYEKRMEERVIERQLKNTSKVAESVNTAIASKSFACRPW